MEAFRKQSCRASAFMLALLIFCRSAKAENPTNLLMMEQATSAQAFASVDDDKWHVGLTPYLWFAGSHGSVGLRGRSASVHATFGEIFTNLNIGIMAATELRRNRIVVPIDYMWLKLSDDKALPLNEPGITSAKVKITQSILTPKVGYRAIKGEKLTADAVVGIRYWHLGTNFSFEPSGLLSSYSQSANWVDVVAGANAKMALSPKATVMIFGDAGAGGANVDYQVAALLGYKVKPNIVMQVGYRYMDVNYRPSSTFVYDSITSGIIAGVTINLK